MARKTEQDEGQEVAVTAEPELQEARFVVMAWNGRPMWQCTACPFDTLDGEPAIVEHYQREHVVPPPAPAVHIAVFDRFGNEVR